MFGRPECEEVASRCLIFFDELFAHLYFAGRCVFVGAEHASEGHEKAHVQQRTPTLRRGGIVGSLAGEQTRGGVGRLEQREDATGN